MKEYYKLLECYKSCYNIVIGERNAGRTYFLKKRGEIMEEEIQEALEKIYNFPIDVKFKDFRKYEVYCMPQIQSFCLPLLYDGKSTLQSNITNIEYKIDKEILKLYKKGE